MSATFPTCISKKELANLRKCFKARSIDEVIRGLRLLHEWDEPELWEHYGVGIHFKEDQIKFGPGEIKKRVLANNREIVGVYVAHRLGLLTKQKALKVFLYEKDAAILMNLTSLERLHITATPSLKNIDAVASLSSLEKLRFSHPGGQMIDMSPLLECRRLKVLTIRVANNDVLPPLGPLSWLETLHIGGRKLTSLQALVGLSGLKELNCGDLDLLTDLSPLANLKSLRRLTLSGNKDLVNLSPLSQLTLLENLQLSTLRGVTDLSPLSHLKSLKELKLFCADSLTHVEGLGGMDSLETLYLCWGPALHDLGGLTGLKSLKVLRIEGQSHRLMSLRDLTGIEGLDNLEELHLERCPIEDLAPLAGLKSLKVLDLRGSKATDLSPLAGLTSLRRLDIRACPGLTDLSPLAGLRKLRIKHGGRDVISEILYPERNT